MEKITGFGVVDLFAGAGGMSEGFSQEGFNILAANDILEEAGKTLEANHKNIKVIVGDIKDISPKKVLISCGIYKDQIDLVIGGPPCQGFSTANRQRLIKDPRNNLYKYFIEFVAESNPKIFVMENVKGILNKSNQIKEDFKEKGYEVDFIVLNAKNFGIPQNRVRAFFIGTNLKNGREIIHKIFDEINKNKFSKEIPLKDALWGLRRLKALSKKNNTDFESEESGFEEDSLQKEENLSPEYILRINRGKLPKVIYNHKARFNNKRDIEIFRRLPQGGKSDHPSIRDIMPYKKREHIFKDKYYKLKEDSTSKTITAHMKFDCHMYIHPWDSRGLTPREAARVQGFPDDYKFEGAFTKWYLQIGNAVPPPLAKIIAKSIKEADSQSRSNLPTNLPSRLNPQKTGRSRNHPKLSNRRPRSLRWKSSWLS